MKMSWKNEKEWSMNTTRKFLILRSKSMLLNKKIRSYSIHWLDTQREMIQSNKKKLLNLDQLKQFSDHHKQELNGINQSVQLKQEHSLSSNLKILSMRFTLKRLSMTSNAKRANCQEKRWNNSCIHSLINDMVLNHLSLSGSLQSSMELKLIFEKTTMLLSLVKFWKTNAMRSLDTFKCMWRTHLLGFWNHS